VIELFHADMKTYQEKYTPFQLCFANETKKGSSDQVTKITRSVWHIYELDTMQILALFQSFNSYQNKLNY